MNEPETPPLPPHLRRRNSISTTTPLPIPTRLILPTKTLHTSSLPNGTASSSPSSFELFSLKPSSLSYTSLKDLLPSNSMAAINSPTAGSTPNSGYEISIRNRLVKQAAWAYLQPMSSSPGSCGPNFVHRIWTKLFSAHSSLASCLRFINFHIISGLSRAIHRFLGAISVFANR